MLPPGQRLDTRDAASGKVKDRLIVQNDLVAAKRVPEVLHELEAIPSILVMLRGIDLPRNMRAFGGEHCDIRLLEHRFGSGAVIRGERDADTGVDSKAHPVEL